MYIAEPQFESANVAIVANSSNCVQITWELPEYPGGIITGYQVCKNFMLQFCVGLLHRATSLLPAVKVLTISINISYTALKKL